MGVRDCDLTSCLFWKVSPGASGRPFGFTTPNGDIEFHWEAQEVINYPDAGDSLQFQSISIDRFLLFKWKVSKGALPAS